MMCRLTPTAGEGSAKTRSAWPRISRKRIPAAPSETASSTTKATFGLTPTFRYFAEVSMLNPVMSMVPTSAL
jgi:hypothetical protein